jgi:hypothetical protein
MEHFLQFTIMIKKGDLLRKTATLPYMYILDLTNYTEMVKKLASKL